MLNDVAIIVSEAATGSQSNGTRTERHPCPWDGCAITLSRSRDIERHVKQMHTKELLVSQCPVVGCTTKPKRPDTWLEHFYTKHLGIRRHCPFCPLSFVYSKALRDHVKLPLHREERETQSRWYLQPDQYELLVAHHRQFREVHLIRSTVTDVKVASPRPIYAPGYCHEGREDVRGPVRTVDYPGTIEAPRSPHGRGFERYVLSTLHSLFPSLSWPLSGQVRPAVSSVEARYADDTSAWYEGMQAVASQWSDRWKQPQCVFKPQNPQPRIPKTSTDPPRIKPGFATSSTCHDAANPNPTTPDQCPELGLPTWPWDQTQINKANYTDNQMSTLDPSHPQYEGNWGFETQPSFSDPYLCLCDEESQIPHIHVDSSDYGF